MKNEVLITIEGEDWKNAISEAFDKNKKDIEVDGFRKGKIPFDVFKTKFGVERLYQDAIDMVLQKGYEKALEESKLEPVSRPGIDIKDINEDKVEINFIIITKPEVKVKKYKNLDVKQEETKVEKEEVEKEISALREKYAEMVAKESGDLKEKDIAIIDFEGFKDGVAFDGGKGTNHQLEIGSKTFIPGFEKQLIGMKKGEEKEIKVTFPEEYPSEDLKGQEVTFKVKLNEIKEKKVPELNEDFFKDLQMENVDSKESLEKVITENLKAQKEKNAENKFIDDLLEEISKNTEVEIPEEMIEEETDRIFNQFAQTLQMQGMEINQYLSMIGKTNEDLKKDMKPEGEKRVLYRLVLEQIALDEKIDFEEKEVNERLEELKEQYKMEEEEFLKAFGGKEMLEYDLKMRKTFEFLKENN